MKESVERPARGRKKPYVAPDSKPLAFEFECHILSGVEGEPIKWNDEPIEF